VASLSILARLFSGEEEPLAGQLVNIEIFDLAARRWRAVAEAQSDRDGMLKAEIDLRQLQPGALGPALRLVEDDGEGRVLASGPMLSLRGRAGALLADFGEIEVLGDAAFPRLDSEGGEGHAIAGVARKKGLPQGAIIRNVERNPELGVIVAGEASRPGGGETLIRTNLDPRVSAELETLHAINLDNSAKLSERDRLIATKDHELALKTTELENALARAGAAEGKLAEAEDRLAEAQTASRGEPAPIDAVVTNIGTRIGAASTTLRTSDNPFRIGTIRLDLKGSLAEDGRIYLGGDKLDGSGFSIEMTPDDGAGRGDVPVAVPDVTGLTESAARRVLRSVGLRLSAATQPMARGAATHGQSLRQTPAAGRSVPHGSDVIVVFAIVSGGQETP
jgi:hypothetical protein